HERPGTAFEALDRHIRANLDVMAPARRSAIPLTPSGQNLYTGAIRDDRAFGQGRWILGVRSSIQSNEVVARVPALVKVCSAMYVLELVKRAYPGLRLDHLPFPPAQISPRSDTQYFAIERTGACWNTIVSSKEMGVYVPDAIPEVQLDLSIVIEGNS